jgi:hypothetical protein
MNNLMRYIPSKKTILIVLGVLAVLLVIYALSRTAINAVTLGTLDATATSSSAKLTTIQGDQPPQAIGTGHAQVQLKPGVYQITATASGTATTKLVTVSARQTTTVSLSFQKLVPTQNIAHYGGRDVFAGAAGSLYFLNLDDQFLYQYPFGAPAGRPYLVQTLNNLTRAYFVSPTQVYTLQGDSWFYTASGQSTPLVADGNQPSINSISFNKQGAVSFISSSGTIAYAAVGNQPLQKLGTAPNAQTSLAPNGSILIYTPADATGQPAPTRLYQNGSFTTLPSETTGLINAQWNPDSSSFSYATSKGLFIYNLTTHTITQVLAETQINPPTVTWLSPTSIIFTDQNAIWRYQTSTNESTKLADVVGSIDTSNPFVVAPDGQTIFFPTSSDEGGHGNYIMGILPNYNDLSVAQQTTATTQLRNLAASIIPNYVGTDDLLSNGVTSEQVTLLEYVLGQYLHTAGLKPSQVNIGSIQTAPHNPNSTSDINTSTFNISFDNGNTVSYNARIDASGTTGLRLYVLDPRTNHTVFDSGTVDSSN